MKFSRFNKKRVILALSLLLILLMISVLCSFSFRPSVYEVSIFDSRPSVEAVQNIMSILQYQKDLNGLPRSNNILLLVCVPQNSYFSVYAFVSSNTSFNYTINGDVINFSFSGTQVFYYNSSTGFWGGQSIGTHSTNVKNIYYSSVALPESSIPGFQGFNSNATFGRSSFNSYDVMSYFKHIHDAALYLDEYVSEAYSEGLATGQGEGYQVGLEDGYNQGYDSGYADGEDRGYIEGQTEGYSEGFSEGYSEGESFGSASGYRDGFDDGREEGYTFGYDSGYDDGYKRGEDIGQQTGYSEGYSEGYETGLSDGYDSGYDDGLNNSDFNKPGQIKAYFWRYRNDSDFQGNVYFSSTVNAYGTTLYRWCSQEELETHWQGFTIFEFTYDTNLFFQNNPLEFDYYIPQIVRDNGAAAYSIKEVKYEYVDLYERRALVELSIDGNLVGVLNGKYQEGIRDSNALVNGVSDIATKPIKSLKDALDFDIFGINIGAVAVGLVAILFAIWAYNKIRKLLPI